MGFMPAESVFHSTNDPILDARKLITANPERTVEEVGVLLLRIGWAVELAFPAARIACKEARAA